MWAAGFPVVVFTRRIPNRTVSEAAVEVESWLADRGQEKSWKVGRGLAWASFPHPEGAVLNVGFRSNSDLAVEFKMVWA
ncbi:hypothetical protein ASF08_10555 [Methylobacterium sp. Leaf85]|nr:hypothetical protein ASF08_10555 [Methylobacterium sp. Leaf85]